MKKSLLLLIVLFLSLNTKAQQVIDIITGMNSEPHRLFTYNDYMYVTSNDYIYRFSLYSSNPVLEELYHVNYDDFASMDVYNGNLYIATFYEGAILKMDLNSNPPTVTTFISGLDGPNGLVIKDNYLYFSESSLDQISIIDLTNANATPQVIITGVDYPAGLAFNGDDLYVAEIWGDKVSKINLTTFNKIDIVSIDAPIGIKIINQHLYVASILEDRIVKIDLSSYNPPVEDVITNVSEPVDIAFAGGDMYFALLDDNKISKIENVELGINETNAENINILPNPATDYIYISTPETMDDIPYSIISSEGKEVLSGNLNAEQIINIQNLQSGIYILLLDNQFSKKIIKK